MLNARTLAAVRALADFSSFQEAAQSQNMSAATFSRHIAKAEEYCGFLLFERRKNGSAPTEGGRRFLALTEDLTASLARFDVGLSQARTAQDGFLRIGCGPLTTDTIIAPVLSRILSERPNLRLKVVVRATKEPIEALRVSALDVVVVDLTHTTDLGNLDIAVLQKRSVGFFARSDHPIHDRGPLSAREVFEYPMASAHLHKHWRAAVAAILGGDQAAWSRVEQMPAIECDDFSLLARLTRNTDHVCTGMPETYADAVAAGTHREVRLSHPLPWNICAARRSDASFPALELFWTELIEAFAEQPE
jgi:DNA-binding transcriptional LysR family regulator